MVDAHRFPRSIRLLSVARPRGCDNRRLLQNLRTIQTKSHSTLGFGRPGNSGENILCFSSSIFQRLVHFKNKTRFLKIKTIYFNIYFVV